MSGLVFSLLAAPSCARAPETPAVVHPARAARGAANPTLARPAAPASEAPPSAAGSPAPEAPPAPSLPSLPVSWDDDTVLRVYREVYCTRRLGSEASVVAVWERHGVDAEGWAAAVQAAAEKAALDPEGFGQRWAAITAEPCEGER